MSRLPRSISPFEAAHVDLASGHPSPPDTWSTEPHHTEHPAAVDMDLDSVAKSRKQENRTSAAQRKQRKPHRLNPPQPPMPRQQSAPSLATRYRKLVPAVSPHLHALTHVVTFLRLGAHLRPEFISTSIAGTTCLMPLSLVAHTIFRRHPQQRVRDIFRLLARDQPRPTDLHTSED